MPPKRHKTVAFVVPETHWDRAWYLSFEHFRIKLVKLTEDLLTLLDRKPRYRFTFDGQTVVLEDVLQVRPDFEHRLKKHVKSGQLSVGPWYILPDEYLVSGEALVRNLLIGHRIAARFGNVMKAGYIPDPFGHVSQIPQILDGFGIRGVLFARGLGDAGSKLGLEFRWVAPDGKTSVMACHLVAGYGNLHAWGGVWGVELFEDRADFDYALEQARKAIEFLHDHKPSTKYVLLNNGVDHMPAQPAVPEMIDHVNARIGDAKLVQGNYQDFIEAVLKEEPALKPYTGELHDGKYHPVLSGVFSARMYLKQANEKSQRQLEAYAEPLCAFASLQGMRYPGGFLTYAWKELLKNHPHDDICGCSIDAVHQDMMNRFAHVQQVSEELSWQGLAKLSDSVDTASGPEGVPFVVFNPTPWRRSEVVKVKRTIEADRLPGRKAMVIDPKGLRVAAVIKVSKSREQNFWSAGRIRGRKVKDVEAEFLALDLPPFGLKTYYVAPLGTPEIKPGVVVRGTTLENDFLRVAVAKDGSVTITDKTTKAVFSGGHVFEDTEDVGDEYDYSPLLGKASQTFTSRKHGKVKSIRVVEKTVMRAAIRIEMQIRVPNALAPNRKRRAGTKIAIPITTVIALQAGARRVSFATTIDNRAKDHRMRVLFSTPIKTGKVHAGSKFDVVTRPVEFPKCKGWSQQPVPTQHVDRFVSIDNGKIGFTLINRGLPEYEARKDKGGVTLCQTLFRACGFLSRDDFVTRPYHAGPPIQTPEAQCPGPNTYEYAVVPHKGDWEQARTYIEAYNHNSPVMVRAAERQEGPLPLDFSFLRLAPDSLVLSAVKKAEEGDGLIVRVFNIATRRVKGTLRFQHPLKSAELANLNEETLGKATVRKGNEVAVDVPKKGIVTLRVRFNA